MTLEIKRLCPSLAVFTALLTGCPSVDDGNPTDTNEPVFIDAAIVGSWVSEGDDVSPLFVTSGFTRLTADFEDDGTYVATAVDGTGATYTFRGTYTVDDSTDPASIVASQTSPFVATAEGIWAVGADGSLQYEVVQTTPATDFTPPTPATGFGSTSGPGMSPGDNVQIYR